MCVLAIYNFVALIVGESLCSSSPTLIDRLVPSRNHMERPKGPHECGAAEARITCVWGSRRQPHMSVERPKGSHATCVWSGRGSHHMCVGQPKAAPHECVAAEKPTGVWNCQRLHHMCVGQPKATPTECGAAEGPTCVWSGRKSSRMCVGHPCT